MTFSTMMQWLSSGVVLTAIPALVLRWEAAAHRASLAEHTARK